jgi:NAD(P)-dependent dehydrogenase (short-subunit alcohol dehydrogenase family)
MMANLPASSNRVNRGLTRSKRHPDSLAITLLFGYDVVVQQEAPRCIVFGGSGSLGRVVCRTLLDARAGAKVGFTYHSGEAVASALGAEGAIGRRLDLASTRDIPRVLDELRDELGGITAFIHCAALGSANGSEGCDRIHDPNDAGWDRLMAINLKSAFFACQHLAAAHWAEKPGGNVVFLGSIDGEKSVSSPVPYATSKGALSAMARSLAKELGPRGIRVNVVAPGILESGATSVIPDDVRREYLKHSGAKRYGRHEEVARIVAFLATENTYVTGQTLIVDGGL